MRILTSFSLLATLAVGQALIFEDVALPFDNLGWGVAIIGDLDGDGFKDFAAGANKHDGPAGVDSGMLRVYSGATGQRMATFYGLAAGDRFGNTVAGGGDMDGDGVPEIVVGAPFEQSANLGSITVLSGATGLQLYKKDGASSADLLGVAIAAGKDVSGDGVPDFLATSAIGTSTSPANGFIQAWSGADGSLLWSRAGVSGDALGYYLSLVDDITGDGRADVVAGAPYADFGAPNAGQIQVLSGLDGSTVLTVNGTSGSARLGWSVAGLPDMNADGIPDFLGGAWSDDTMGSNAGFAAVYSGADGTVIQSWLGSGADQHFGSFVGAIGDVDGDTVADFVVAASDEDVNGLVDAGVAHVFSGSTLAEIDTIDGDDDWTYFSRWMAGGDLDGDGMSELVVGGYGNDLLGPDGGIVRMYSYGTYGGGLQSAWGPDDLLLESGVGLVPNGAFTKNAQAGSILTVRISSPNGTLVGAQPLLGAQAMPTGILTTGTPGLVGVHLDFLATPAPVFLIDTPIGPFGPNTIPLGGFQVAYTLPPGLEGQSILIQAAALSPAAPPYVASGAHEIRVQ